MLAPDRSHPHLHASNSVRVSYGVCMPVIVDSRIWKSSAPGDPRLQVSYSLVSKTIRQPGHKQSAPDPVKQQINQTIQPLHYIPLLLHISMGLHPS
jgi:hypothetical protein